MVFCPIHQLARFPLLPKGRAEGGSVKSHNEVKLCYNWHSPLSHRGSRFSAEVKNFEYAWFPLLNALTVPDTCLCLGEPDTFTCSWYLPVLGRAKRSCSIWQSWGWQPCSSTSDYLPLYRCNVSLFPRSIPSCQYLTNDKQQSHTSISSSSTFRWIPSGSLDLNPNLKVKSIQLLLTSRFLLLVPPLPKRTKVWVEALLVKTEAKKGIEYSSLFHSVHQEAVSPMH